MEPPIQPTKPNVTPECKTVVTQQPYTEQVCQNVSKMEEICQTRELNYSMSKINKTELCVEKNLCVNWYQNGSCISYYCSKGMTRCKATLTNLDLRKAGTWSVNADFIINGSIFQKTPIKKTILPKESAVFDFSQFYDMDLNQKKPICKIFVVSPAKLQDCSFITKILEECSNVTKYKEVKKQVCG